METDHRFAGVGAQIRMNLPTLTNTEARVAHTVTEMKELRGSTSVKSVAAAAGVSEALVIKVSKKLGFDGFKEMKNALIGYRNVTSTYLYDEIAEGDTLDQVASKVFKTSIQSLEETLAILDIDAVARAAKVLSKAGKVDIYGVGGSAQIARDLAHKFLRIGRRFHVYDDNHMMMMSAAVLGNNDVIVGISHSGQTESILTAAELAKNNGATVISLTNYPLSTLASLADINLASTALGGPLLGENAAARIAQLNIMDVIFVEVARADSRLTEQHLNSTSSAVAQKRRP